MKPSPAMDTNTKRGTRGDRAGRGDLQLHASVAYLRQEHIPLRQLAVSANENIAALASIVLEVDEWRINRRQILARYHSRVTPEMSVVKIPKQAKG